MKYRTIVADPPWPYPAGGGPLGSSPEHRPNSWERSGPTLKHRYKPMKIKTLCDLSVPRDANAHLFLWTTNAYMDEAYDVARAWGFEPKTIGTWGKVKPDGSASMKTGYYFRGATEHCLLAVRGSLPFRKDAPPIPTLWLWPRLPHSVKPDAFYDLVETISPGPYLELFARRNRLGWDTWGDEALAHVEMSA